MNNLCIDRDGFKRLEVWTDIPVPATRYEVPPDSFVSDPERAGAVTAPEKVDPEIVATISLSKPIVTFAPAPPSVIERPDPALSTRSLDREPVAAMTIYCAPGSPPAVVATTLFRKSPM